MILNPSYTENNVKAAYRRSLGRDRLMVQQDLYDMDSTTTVLGSKTQTDLSYYECSSPWEYLSGEGVHVRGRTFDHGGALLHFIHGNGFAGGVYWPFLKQFLSQFSLVTHDTQGHGDSDKSSLNGSFVFPGWETTVQRVNMALQNNDLNTIRPKIAIAHSFGCNVTLQAVLARPHDFDAVVFLDPVFFPRRIMAFMGIAMLNPMVKQALNRTKRWESRAAAWEYFYQRGIFKNWRDDSLAAYLDTALQHHADGSLTLKCPREMEASIFQSPPPNLWENIEKLRLPTLLLYGEQSYDFVPKMAKRAAKLNPKIQVEHMAGGHCFMQEQPEIAATRVKTWLNTRLAKKIAY